MKNRLSFVKIAFWLMIAALAYGQEAPEPPVPPQPPPALPAPPAPPAPMAPRAVGRGSRHDEYRAGQSALDRREYVAAIDAFNRVIAEKGDRADGAYYWRAYAQNKAGRRNEALATLAELKSAYPGSRWLEDARALEVEVRQASGAPVSPDSTGDEDMKLLALSGLMNSDPERVLPALEKLLKSSQSPKVKERALFLLAQNGSSKTRALLIEIAKGGSNPDLQMKAVEYLGTFGGRESGQALTEIYKGSNDAGVKRSVLRGFMISGNREAVLSVARGETNTELRMEAIRQLGAMGGSAELSQLYGGDAPVEVKKAIIQGLFVAGQWEKVLEIARNEKDPSLRRTAIRQLGIMGSKTADGLVSIYAKETEQTNKRAVIDALFIQGNAKALIEIARKETDPNLKREAVQKLSIMGNKDATDFLMELLNK